MTGLFTGTAIHAQRRADELKGSIELLIDAGLKYYMTSSKGKTFYASII